MSKELYTTLEEIRGCFKTGGNSKISINGHARILNLAINKGGVDDLKHFVDEQKIDVRKFGYAQDVKSDVNRMAKKLTRKVLNYPNKEYGPKDIEMLLDICTLLERYVQDTTYLQDHNYVYSKHGLVIDVNKLDKLTKKFRNELINYHEGDRKDMLINTLNKDIQFLTNEEIYENMIEISPDFYKDEIDKDAVIKHFPSFGLLSGDIKFVELEREDSEDEELLETIGLFIFKQPTENGFSTYTIVIVDANYNEFEHTTTIFKTVDKASFPLYIQNLFNEYEIDYITGKNAENLLILLNE
ncbi:hypothetical protein ACFOZ1_08880 [Gracilibacillus marinus]|uniref:Uncharacterized protein n=1 Tax=Gracilibacillus marinus TaxID=630535 RepID=A0ABV8VUN8_9BACI